MQKTKYKKEEKGLRRKNSEGDGTKEQGKKKRNGKRITSNFLWYKYKIY